MRRYLKLLVLTLAAGPLAASVGCERIQSTIGGGGATAGPTSFLPDRVANLKTDGTATPGQEAIVRVLEADREQFHAGYGALRPDAQPSDVGKFIGEYVSHLEKSDVTGCPYEFREARTRNAKAWAALKTIIERHPDSYDDVEFMESLRALFRGDKSTKGRKLGGDIIEAVERVAETFGEVYTRAEGYGVEVN